MTTASQQRRPDLDRLYCINEDGSRNTIHAADVRGRYQRRKRAIWTILIAIYLAVPWLVIGGHPAVLIDIEHRNFFLLGHAFGAPDFWLAFFVLTGIGFTLFVVSALFGRLWCGYACPHTVFLDGVFRRIERWLEGSAAQRKLLAESRWTRRKLAIRGTKWAIYALLALVLSHTALGYFVPIRTVVAATTGSPGEHPTAFVFVLVLTAIIYFDFAWFREQLCIVICPYGRLQSLLYDQDTVVVGYDRARGEPRGKYHAEQRGHCIDCFRCVAVCPTGIDIRNGTQLECIGCANCIDACDEVMAKLDQPPGLVRYDSQRGLEGGARKFWRPRLALYAVLLLAGIAVFASAIGMRAPFEAKVVRLPGPAFTVDEAGVRNAFFVHLINKDARPRAFTLAGEGSDGVAFVVPATSVELAALEDRRVPVFVLVPPARFRPDLRAEIVVRSEARETRQGVALFGPAPVRDDSHR